ncbi:hypothetical protein AVDCRST_MAG94-3050 [uncultured Leptolyngbya sp.]|uniref:Uncharacterized protein n=1 Tax=uncultured Leptolyngbya sp. TaxID=332963 RepID=A0A6J4MC02_9CYAN|nr:hypothetical protein AVDCRST_MAG94-3050 [uncultured Leptolyngbya sp.]
MNGFDCKTQTTLTASATDLAQANSAGLDFTARTHVHRLNASLNFHSRSSNLTTLMLTIWEQWTKIWCMAMALSTRMLRYDERWQLQPEPHELILALRFGLLICLTSQKPKSQSAK